MNCIDLFCGMGGFSEGFKMSGIGKVKLAIDNWAEALTIHEYNNPKCKHILMSLGGSIPKLIKIFNDNVKRPIYLHGSPPCQKLSNANQNKTKVDVKNGLAMVIWYLRLVEKFKPERWSMEQVTGLLKHKTILFKKFPWLKKCNFDVISGEDYGIPQSRKRLFVGYGWNLPPKAPKEISRLDNWLDLEGHLIKGYTNTRSVKVNGVHSHNRQLEGLEGYRRLDQPAFTQCASGPLKLFKLKNKVPVKLRNLTDKESLIIQGFPKTFTFPPNTSNTLKYKTIGNSVIPFISFIITSNLK